MSVMLQNYHRLHDDTSTLRGSSWTPQVSLESRRISQLSPRLICSLWALCTALLFSIFIILIVIVTGQTEQNIELRLRNLSLEMDSRVEQLSQDDYRTLAKLMTIETSMGDFKDLLTRDSQRIMKEVDKLAEELQKGTDSKMMEKMSALEMSMKGLKGPLSKDFPNVVEAVAIQTEEIQKMKGSLSSDIQRILGAIGKQTEEIQKGSGSLSKDMQRVSESIEKATEEKQTGKRELCASGWMNFGGSCYLWCTSTHSWSSTKKECEDLKAHLVVINDSEENIFLQAFSQEEIWWIGLVETNNTWGWVDATSYETTPKFWQPGQPDDYKNHGLGGGEDCAQLRKAQGWNDAPCSKKHFYICEKKIY